MHAMMTDFYISEAEREFNSEVREKNKLRKRSGGVSKKKPKKIIFPMDFGDKQYCRSGPVFVYNIEGGKSKMMNIKQFLTTKDPKEAQEIFKTEYAKYSDRELSEMWGTKESFVKKMRYHLGVLKNRKGNVITLLDESEMKWDPTKFQYWGSEGGEEITTHAVTGIEEGVVKTEEKGKGKFYLTISADMTAKELGDNLHLFERFLPREGRCRVNFSVEKA